MKKTLKDYIEFLRKNGLAQEAQFYETEVISLLKQFGFADPLSMAANEIPAMLYEIHDILTAELNRLNKGTSPNTVWDVELHATG